MAKARPPLNVRKTLGALLFKSLLVPLLLLVFFLAAPPWLNSRLREAAARSVRKDVTLAPAERERGLARLAVLDYQQVCRHCPPGLERLRASLEKAGFVGQFRRLEWGRWLSLALVVGLGLAIGSVFALRQRAGQSPEALIRCYRLAWRISIAAALGNVFLLIPLLAYGTFEFSVLLTDRYYPKLLAVIVVGGVLALWRSAAVLLKRVPLQFKEPMSREVTPEEAPELWQKVREAAGRLETAPPEHIIVGLQLNFYVTELAVLHDAGKAEGRTLYLSYPLLRGLPEEEVLAIIGHELGHFLGADTRLTREFYPLRLKIGGTVVALAQSGFVGWPSFWLLNLFGLAFAEREQTTSRSRELLADQKGALLTSARTAARALVRFQVLAEAFQRGLQEAIKSQAPNPLNLSLLPIIRARLAPETAFWTHLFETTIPHPLDSHPALQVRLAALGQNLSPADAQAIALEETRSAYEQWFSQREALFAGLTSQAEAAVDKMRARAQIAEADYETAAGRELLEQHFPEKKWRRKPSGLLTVMAFLGLVVAVFAAIALFLPEPKARVAGALGAIVSSSVMAIQWRRHWPGELTLNAEGLGYTGWKRPLRFKDVEKVRALRRSASSLTLKFRLKQRAESVWKCAWPPVPRKEIGLSLSGFGEQPGPIAQTVFRYLTRQTEQAVAEAEEQVEGEEEEEDE